METKYFSGNIIEHKQVTENGIPIGIVKGYIATWDIDQENDKFEPNAFKDSLEIYRKDGRLIPMRNQHGALIGGYPIAKVFEDSKGLLGEGEINLELQEGRDAYSLVRQGVMRKKSIGYSAVEHRRENGVRLISKAKIYEGSVVDHPMNLAAAITEVKEEKKTLSVTDLKNLPMGELVKSFRSVLSKDAADFVASLIMARILADDSGAPVKMFADLVANIKTVRENIKLCQK